MSGKGNLNKRFQDYGAAPASGAWEGISAALPKKRRKKALMWWIGGSGAVAASILIAFLVIHPTKKEDSRIAIQSQVEHQDKLVEHKKDKGGISNLSGKVLIDSKVVEPNSKTATSTIIEEKIASHQQSNHSNGNKVIQQQVSHSVSFNKPIPPSGDEFVDEINRLNESPDMTLMKNRTTELIVVEFENIALAGIGDIGNKISNWQIGGRLNSNRALGSNTEPYYVNNTFSSNYTWQAENNDLASLPAPAPNPNPGPNNKDTITYKKVNQPISVSLFGRLNLTRRLFTQMELDLNYMQAEHLFKYPGFRNTTRFFSVGADLKFGFKVIDKRRWGLDFAGGLNIEKLFQKAGLITKENPLFLWGPIGELGLSYHLNENISLRLSPHYRKSFGNSEYFFYSQFQKKANIGIGLSILKSW